MGSLKDRVVQINQAVVLSEAQTNFGYLTAALQKDKGIALTLDQSYMSKYDVADELRKFVKDKTNKPSAEIKPLLDANKTIADIVKEGQFDKLKEFLDGLSAADFEPPLPSKFKSPSGVDVFPVPGKISNDPRRTGRIIQPGPSGTLAQTEVQKWMVNNSVLYGFVPYSDNALYYIGVEQIKSQLKSASNKQDQLSKIVGKFLKNGQLLSSLTVSAQTVIDNKLPDAGIFPDPGNLEGIPNHGVMSNDKRILDLVVVDGQPVWRPAALAALAMQAEAKKQGVNLSVTSGFRPAFGKNVKVTTTKGRQITMTTQETLRRDKSRWVGRGSFSGSDEDFIFKAGSSKYSAATAPPGSSNHGSGIAIDWNVGGRNNFSPLKTANYVWLARNAHKFGFVRTVGSEEWHWEYLPAKAKNGPYAVLSNKESNKWYADLALNNLTV
jgi:hypothetical protein